MHWPGEALRVPGGSGSQISLQPAHEGDKVVSLTHRPPLSGREYSWYSFLLEAESTSRAIVTVIVGFKIFKYNSLKGT